jgi:hypothetical protein
MFFDHWRWQERVINRNHFIRIDRNFDRTSSKLSEYMGPVFFFSNGSYFYDRPNSLLLDIEPVLFTNSEICGRFWGTRGEFGRNRPGKKTLDTDLKTQQCIFLRDLEWLQVLVPDQLLCASRSTRDILLANDFILLCRRGSGLAGVIGFGRFNRFILVTLLLLLASCQLGRGGRVQGLGFGG